MQFKVAGQRRFSPHQQVALCLAGLGSVLCMIGYVSPCWFTGKVRQFESRLYHAPDFRPHETFDVQAMRSGLERATPVMDVTVGPFVFCVRPPNEDFRCSFAFAPFFLQGNSTIGISHDIKTKMPKAVFEACMSFTLVGSLLICLYCLTCCRHPKVFVLGLCLFFAGILGLFIMFLLFFYPEVLVGFSVTHVTPDWALFLFWIGDVLVMLGGLGLCVLKPAITHLDYQTVLTLTTGSPIKSKLDDPLTFPGKEMSPKLICP